MKPFIVFQVFFFLLSPNSSQAADPPKKTPELISKGKLVYQVNCIVCHGAKGDGLGSAGKYMSPKPRNLKSEKFKMGESVSEIFNSVTKGIDGTAMTGFPTMPEAERWAVAYYVQSFKEKNN